MQLSGCLNTNCVCASARGSFPRPWGRSLQPLRKTKGVPVRVKPACCNASGQESNSPLPSNNKDISKPLIAGGAVGFGIAAFVALNLASGAPTFENLERASIPLDTALQNGKPTVIEFYASWCKICRELLPDTLEVQKQYRKDVNFVALNIESSRWAPEVSEYRVRGIPYYAFLDGAGHQQAAAVGRLPREVLEGDTRALAQGQELPFARVQQAASSTRSSPARPAAQPRDHS